MQVEIDYRNINLKEIESGKGSAIATKRVQEMVVELAMRDLYR